MAENTTVFTIEVALARVEPKVWRRLSIPADYSLAQVHRILQIAMCWGDDHLHVFNVGENEYSDPAFDLGETEDEGGLTLAGAFSKSTKHVRYVYDFGDDWVHDLKLLERKSVTGEDLRPQCIAGARACPPEDIGGPGGYARFLKVISDPTHEEYEEMLEWAGGPFDPEAFNHRDVDAALVGWWQRSQ